MFLQSPSLEKLYQKVFRLPENRWILDDPSTFRCIQILFEALPPLSIKYLTTLELFFIRSDGILASTVAPRKKGHLIIIYPELVKMMKSAAPLLATAVLAHELGHIVLKHSVRKIDPTRAQIEADHFVAKIGFGGELRQVLLDYKGSPDYSQRLNALQEHSSTSG